MDSELLQDLEELLLTAITLYTKEHPIEDLSKIEWITIDTDKYRLACSDTLGTQAQELNMGCN